MERLLYGFVDLTKNVKFKLYSTVFSTGEEECEFNQRRSRAKLDSIEYPPLEIEITLTIKQLIETWDGVIINNKSIINSLDKELMSVLRYSPYAGKTYNDLNVPHFKSVSRKE